MPELPEVETIARQLHAGLTGRRLGALTLSRADIVRAAPGPLADLLPGRGVIGVTRRAKRVIVALDPPGELIFHLGMTGRLTITPAGAPLEPHTHLRIGVENGELRFRDPRRFGGVWLLAAGDGATAPRLGALGPEPLTLRLPEFRRILARRRQIKALLMDQAAIAGLGNIYCDESLHAARVHPLTPACDLPLEGARRLLHAIKRILRRAINHRGTTFMDYRSPDGQPGSFQRLHRVYQRDGSPCKTCRTKIVRMVAAGRGTFLCPRCQRR